MRPHGQYLRLMVSFQGLRFDTSFGLEIDLSRNSNVELMEIFKDLVIDLIRKFLLSRREQNTHLFLKGQKDQYYAEQ